MKGVMRMMMMMMIMLLFVPYNVQEMRRLEAESGPALMDVEEEGVHGYYHSNQVRCWYNHAISPLSLFLPAMGLTPLLSDIAFLRLPGPSYSSCNFL